jgi:hypothetical protein
VDRPMLVQWNDRWKPAPCSEAEFTDLYDTWTTAARFDIKAMLSILKGKGYGRAEAIELLVLMRRRDAGGINII